MSFNSITVLSNTGFNALNDAEKLLFSGLQGLANRGSNALYCVCNNFNNLAFSPLAAEFWLQQLPLRQTVIDDAWLLLDQYGSVKSYILCDMRGNGASANIASSLAGVLGALPADKSLAAKLNARNYKQVLDVSSWSLADMLDKYKSKLNLRFAVELNNSFKTSSGGGIAWGPRDYAVTNQAVVFFGNSERQEVMKLFSRCSPIYGWGPLSGGTEYQFINDTGAAGNYYVAADAAYNLSVFSQIAEQPKPVPAQPLPLKPADKYVAFMISDGDNLQWLLNRGNCSNWWGSPLRGQIPLGWTMAPSLYSLAPTLWNYYIGSLTAQDEIICGASGIGYVFDNIADNAKFPAFTGLTGAFLAAAKIGTVASFGNDIPTPYPNPKYLQGFTGQAAVKGVIYSSFRPWVVPGNQDPVVYGGKAVIPTTLNLNGNPGAIAEQILAGGNSPPVYLVYADAWGNQNEPLESIKQVCDQLAGQAEIVKPSQLFALVSSN